jgi:hypothetical protein
MLMADPISFRAWELAALLRIEHIPPERSAPRRSTRLSVQGASNPDKISIQYLADSGADDNLLIMSRFWLTYKQDGRLLGVAPSALGARKCAAHTKGLAPARFASATELLVELAALIPASAIGRMLGPNQVARLITKLGRRIQKIC